MDIREHSLALISVVIGLGLTSLLGGFNRLMRRRREFRWNALPLVWALVVLLLVNNYWWGLYLGAVAVAASNVDMFLLGLLFPILLYLICAAVLPDARALRERDLLAAYFSESRYFFALITLYVFVTGWATAAHAGAFHWNEHMWLRLVIISLCFPLMWTRKILLHWLAAIGMLAIMAYVLFEMVLH